MELETKSPEFLLTQIDDETIQAIYASDQEMYPAPLQFSRLQSWVTTSPELSICFRRQGVAEDITFGVIIALPILRHFWEDLITGAIHETDLDPDTMFPQQESQGVEVGLHIFHIERLSTPDGSYAPEARFSTLAVGEVLDRAKRKWTLVGLSGTEIGESHFFEAKFLALTATPAGNRTFKRLGFKATGYNETLLRCDPAANDVQMICSLPDGRTWPPGAQVPGPTDPRVISATEMTAKRFPNQSASP